MYASIYIALLAAVPVFAATAAEWRSRSIYQILTDRFGRPDESTTASCNLSNYCGGTWQGIIDRLDYIQDMGFTAVCLVSYRLLVYGLTWFRYGSHLSLRSCVSQLLHMAFPTNQANEEQRGVLQTEHHTMATGNRFRQF